MLRAGSMFPQYRESKDNVETKNEETFPLNYLNSEAARHKRQVHMRITLEKQVNSLYMCIFKYK